MAKCVKKLYIEFAKAREEDVEIRCADLSAGISMSTKGQAFEECYTEADKALYYVKQNGKGNYLFYEEMESRRGEKMRGGWTWTAVGLARSMSM